MSDITENTIENPSTINEIMPTTWTFLKAFWSATWRGGLYSLPFVAPFTINMPNPSLSGELYIFCVSIILLFPAMWQLNRLIYHQGTDLIRLEIDNRSILFYLFLVSIPYLIVLFISYVIFGKINIAIQSFMGLIPNLFIFHRIMTKGIMGHKIITRKIPQ